MPRVDESVEAKMARLVAGFASCEGYSDSALEGVQFIKLSEPLPRHPVMYNPSIVIVAQGRKIGYLGEEAYTYDPDNYLVLTVPLPFECETFNSPEHPFLALSVGVDQALLRDLVFTLDEFSPHSEMPRCIHTSETTPELKEASLRLLECLTDPMESRVLGKQIVREILFRALRGPQGWALRALAGVNGNFLQVSKALHLIHHEYHRDLGVETLAKATNMSTSGFHHVFKAVTATSPIQYIKSVRLHKARTLMVQDGLNVNSAAEKVGYASSSQFSREFKRFFGKSPKDEALVMRKYKLPSLLKPQ